MTIDVEEIKKILVSKPGKRLITCLALLQPLTANELKHFPKLCYEAFKPGEIKTREFPNVANVILDNKYPKFRELFHNKDFYAPDRVIKKAVKSGLLLEIPVKKRAKKDNYYFLNSDIIFTFKKNGVEISEMTTSFLYRLKHHVITSRTLCFPKWAFDEDYEKYYKAKREKREIVKKKILSENIQEYISLPIELSHKAYFKTFRPSSLNDVFVLFWWLIKHDELIKDTINTFRESGNEKLRIQDLPKTWKSASHLLNYAYHDKVLRKEKDGIFLGYHFNYLTSQEINLIFSCSYQISKCFSNYDKHAKDIVNNTSPKSLIDILSSENYQINPSRRPLVFSSLLINPTILSGKEREKKIFIDKRNTQLVKASFCSDIIWDFTVDLESHTNVFLSRGKLFLPDY